MIVVCHDVGSDGVASCLELLAVCVVRRAGRQRPAPCSWIPQLARQRWSLVVAVVQVHEDHEGDGCGECVISAGASLWWCPCAGYVRPVCV